MRHGFSLLYDYKDELLYGSNDMNSVHQTTNTFYVNNVFIYMDYCNPNSQDMESEWELQL